MFPIFFSRRMYIYIYIIHMYFFQSGLGGPGLCAILVDLDNCLDASYINIFIFIDILAAGNKYTFTLYFDRFIHIIYKYT